jgi:hypothetical protein
VKTFTGVAAARTAEEILKRAGIKPRRSRLAEVDSSAGTVE